MMDKEQQEIRDVEEAIGYILRVGVMVSASVIGLGLILMLINGGTGYPPEQTPADFQTIWQGLIQLKAGAYVMLGLFCLILTPVLRVIVSIWAFAKEKDYLYVWITVIVLVILVFGMLTGYVEH